MKEASSRYTTGVASEPGAFGEWERKDKPSGSGAVEVAIRSSSKQQAAT